LDYAVHELYHEAYDKWAEDPTGKLAELGVIFSSPSAPVNEHPDLGKR